ncbi:hypothetical protein [Pseudomonas sp. PSKL.D1]|uniref:hypothetical protein n=1 Tax=Pseudomonas sp. PSKL.D1 TaxID=3029060 RepID=UPI002381440E|nr:hypothetical protein [Pseudomonas sp. PSKL.D1]WDY56573.1 hypothetical protein PVV54_18540 [Pseudomonas sp. PSKL.D1]
MESRNFTLRRSGNSPANAILTISCLSPEDLQTGRTRLQGLHDLLLELDAGRFEYNRNFAHLFEAESSGALSATFQEIYEVCDIGIDPILFIDGHGDELKGMRMPNGEWVSWKSLLEHFQPMIDRTRGQLTVIIAACHSMAAIKHVDSNRKLPFSFYYGYPSEISAGVVQDETEKIYRSLLLDHGKILVDEHRLRIECFSEYDHLTPALAPALLLSKSPTLSAQTQPELSRNEINKYISVEMARAGRPVKGTRHRINEILGSGALAVQIARNLMHDTERLERVIEDIYAFMKGGALPPLPNDSD